MASRTVTATNNQPTSSATAQALRRAGVLGLAATVAFLATAVLTSIVGGIEPPDAAADMNRFLSEVDDAELGIILYALAGLGLCFLYVPMSQRVADLLKGSRTARLGTRSVIAGLIVLSPAYLIAGISTSGLLRAHNSGAGTDTLFDTYEYLAIVAEVCFGVGSLLSLGIGPLLWGIAATSTSKLPWWMSRLAIGAGALGVIWAIPPTDNAIVTIIVLANVVGSIIVFTTISRALIQAGRSEAMQRSRSERRPND